MALAGAIIAASCGAAMAQAVRVRGTIEKADGNVLSLKSSDGAELKLTLREAPTGAASQVKPWNRPISCRWCYRNS